MNSNFALLPRMWSHLNGEYIHPLFALSTVYDTQSQIIINQFISWLMQSNTFFYIQPAGSSEMLVQS